MQPTLGGPDTMRGLQSFPLYDNNAVLVQGEYEMGEPHRYLVWRYSQMAARSSTIGSSGTFTNWKEVFGFGLRIKTGSAWWPLRIDTGFSHEGVQVWFRVANHF